MTNSAVTGLNSYFNSVPDIFCCYLLTEILLRNLTYDFLKNCWHIYCSSQSSRRSESDALSVSLDQVSRLLTSKHSGSVNKMVSQFYPFCHVFT